MKDAAHAEDTNAQAQGSEAIAADRENLDDMYLTFAIGEEHYGVSITMVTEIVGLQKIMSVPDVPHYIKGVINLRGKVIPLMDVRLRFGMEEKPYDDRTVVIVLQVNNAPIGMIVDGVSEVLDIPPSQIDPASGFDSKSENIVSGIGRIGERVAILLDIGVLVSSADIALPSMTH